jgi:hypothetical protein
MDVLDLAAHLQIFNKVNRTGQEAKKYKCADSFGIKHLVQTIAAQKSVPQRVPDFLLHCFGRIVLNNAEAVENVQYE